MQPTPLEQEKSKISAMETKIQYDPNAPADSSAGIFGLPYSYEHAQLVFLPIPWEATTSYGGGTVFGPEAILNASSQLDLYDLDVDTNLHRRVGLVEKYVVGRWDLQLTSSDRERGEKPRAAAKPPVKDPRNPADRSLPPPPPEETVVVPPLTVPNIPSLPSLPTPSAAGATTPQKPTKPVTAPPTDDF
jgi:hypothetical protein